MVKELYTFNPLRDIGFDRVFARGTYLAPGINIVGDGFLTNIGRFVYEIKCFAFMVDIKLFTTSKS